MVQANFSTGISFFMPIFSFLFVFIVAYALIIKTKILGDNKAVSLFISFILAVFFIVNINMVDWLKFNSAWFAVFFVCLFLILTIITFTHGKIDDIAKPWVAWVLVVVFLLFFIISSAYFFAWTLNWDKISGWVDTEWFGFVLLLILAGIVSWVLAKK